MSTQTPDEDEHDDEKLTEGEEELFDEEGEEADSTDNLDDAFPATVTSSEVIILPSGEALTSIETGEIAAQARPRVIMLAGAQRSGKTTLLASLFQCFQRGPFAKYLFSDSRTLKGFERRCWPSRTASMGRKADTDRTKFGTQNYLHLKVRKKRAATPVDLIFCDLSGEIFERAVNSTEACAEIEELSRIDHLALLVDGNKLRRIDLRAGAHRDARLLLRSLLDSKALSPAIPVEIVFSKIDLFGETPSKAEDKDLYASLEDTELFLKQIKKNISREFSDMKIKVRFIETVARADNPKYNLGQGLEKLLPYWAEEVPPPQPVLTFEPVRTLEREIDKFLEREMFESTNAI